ncbi:hypothetical protein HDU98_002702, partial [Podochytrium sp. JEL0797]
MDNNEAFRYVPTTGPAAHILLQPPPVEGPPTQPQPQQPKTATKYIICPFGPPIQLRPDGRRRRFHAARDQLVLLEQIFQENKKPNAKERIEICKRVNMNPRSLQIWFQNRRAKDKKESGGGSTSPLTPNTPVNAPGPHLLAARHQPPLSPPPMVHNLLATSMAIGTWRRLSLTPEDLQCEIVLSDGILRWSVIESGFCFKMELPITAINDMSVHSVPENASLSSLVLQTNMPPNFFRQMQAGETPSNMSSTPGFVSCSDFTEQMQASSVFCHILEGTHAEMERGFTVLQNFFNEKYLTPATTAPDASFGTASFGNGSMSQHTGVGLAINTSTALQNPSMQQYYYTESAPLGNAGAFSGFLGGPMSATGQNHSSFPLSAPLSGPTLNNSAPTMGPPPPSRT